MQLTVFLGTSGEASFDIELFDNRFVKKWTQELTWCLENCEFNQQEAFAGFITLSDAECRLKIACETINRYLVDFINIPKSIIDQDQQYFNYLHEIFEKLSGGFGSPTRLFCTANPELRSAIRDLNFYVHRVEKKIQTKPNLYLSFNKDQYRRHSLDVTDYDQFQFKFPAGTLFLHYAELGKEFADLYQDNLPIDYTNHKNLHYYSGEATLAFFDFDAFQDKKYVEWLKSHQIDPWDKRHGHGKIPLGKVDNAPSVCSKIAEYNHIYKINIKERI